jgi:hypothetical protein
LTQNLCFVQIAPLLTTDLIAVAAAAAGEMLTVTGTLGRMAGATTGRWMMAGGAGRRAAAGEEAMTPAARFWGTGGWVRLVAMWVSTCAPTGSTRLLSDRTLEKEIHFQDTK